MRYLMAILLVSFLVNCGEENIKYDFRKTTWGMNRESVMKSEWNEPSDIYDFWIWYEDRIVADVNCFIGYFVPYDTLTLGRYFFRQIPVSAEKYWDNYIKLKRLLKSKYGDPMTDTIITEPPGQKIEDPYEAFLDGDIFVSTHWILSRTYVYLNLKNDDDGISLTIDYKSIEHMNLNERAFGERTSADL